MTEHEDRSASHRRIHGMVHWDHGINMEAKPSLVAVGSTERLSDQGVYSDLTLAALMVRPSERDVRETASEKTISGSGKGHYLLLGSLACVVMSLLAAITLLSFYLHASARLGAIYEETDMLYRNQSQRMEDVEKMRERNLVLLNNLSSLKETLTYLRGRTLASLLLEQTVHVLEIARQKDFYQVEMRNYLDLREIVTVNRLLIPRDSPMLQNCQETYQGTRCPFCPALWHLFGSSCYLPSPQTQSWQESWQWCRRQGGHLAVISSSEEQEFLWNLINKTSWIGLSHDDKEGEWTWVDGTPYNSTPKFWNEKQQNNAGNEDCAVLGPGSMWYDDRCRKSYGAVCELQVGELQLPVDAISN